MGTTKKVLIVDDDVALQEFYRVFFSGHQVTFCTSGEDALVLMRGGDAFDLIYLDLEMLGMSGFATLEALKAIPHVMLPPIVVSSSSADSVTQKRALAMGAIAFVPKPIDVDFASSVARRLLNPDVPNA